MPNYSAADVYIVNVDLSQEIEPTATSVGAILVVSPKGETGKPVLVTSPAKFLQKFGTPSDDYGTYAHSALAFLQASNQLYVTRVVEGNYASAGVIVNVDTAGVVTTVQQGEKTPENIDFNPTPDAAFYVYRNGAGTEGNNFAIEIASNNMVTPTNLVATTNTTGGTITAGNYQYRVLAYNKLGKTIFSNTASITTTGSTSVVNLAWDRDPAATGYWIFGATGASTDKLLAIIPQQNSSTINATLLDNVAYDATFTASIILADALKPVEDREFIFAKEKTFILNVFDKQASPNAPVESWEVSLDFMVDGFGAQLKIDEKINPVSDYIKVFVNPDYSNTSELLPLAEVKLTGGLDGNGKKGNPPITDGAFIQAWQQYADKEAITVRLLIESQSASTPIKLAMDDLAKKRGDCLSIISVPTQYQKADKAVDYRNFTLNLNSNRSSMYTPDLKIYDQYNDRQIFVPPAGYVAAVYAFTDATTNAWYAPAGLNRGLLNILGLRYKYDAGERDILSDAKINYMRNFPGLGIAVWECWTLQSKLSAFSFVNVRRLFDLIGVSVSKALLFSEFEPNDDFLRRQIVNMIAKYLETIQNQRGINDFQVVCDSSNNSNPTELARGQLNLDVYIQPTLPTRIIQLKLIATRQGVSVSEAVGNA